MRQRPNPIQRAETRAEVWLPLCVAMCALGMVLLSGCNARDKGVSQASTQEVSKLQTAIELNQRGQSEEALKMIQEALIVSPDDMQALGIAMEIYGSLGQFCEAAKLATRIAESDQENGAALLVRASDGYLRCGDFEAVETSLRRALQLQPEHVNATRLLAQLLNAQGRRFEASQYVLQLIRMRTVEPNEILSLVDLSGPFLLVSYAPFIDESKTSLFLLGKARQESAARGDPLEVIEMVRRVREKFPENTAAAAFEGRLLVEMGRRDEFAQWIADLPQGIEQQPEYWRAVGDWLSLQDQPEQSVRAYGEALLRDPSDRQSLRGMIRSLDVIGKAEQTSVLRDRLAVLERIFRIAKDADVEQSAWIAAQLQELVRPWEAAAWLMYSARLSGQLQQRIPELNQRHQAILAWEAGASVEQIRQARLERMVGFKIDQWPLPDLVASVKATQLPATGDAGSGLQFVDIAEQVGLIAKFESGFPVDGGEFFPHQVNGGGLAALDYDLDGRCDVYVVQSGGQPNDPHSSTANQLFRLEPDQRFSEVTEASGTGDRSFGQGVCAGDVNQDGFPDLLIANIGANVVYVNQGDGTFRQANQLIVDNGDRWTSSLGLGDLDGDHLPELVEINNIGDPQAYKTKCSGDYLNCQPQRFHKAPDRVYTCLGEGTFTPWLDANAKFSEHPSLGFGLIIANFDRQQGNDCFVSNDGDLNHYWTSVAASGSDGKRFELVESASVHGCAVGRDGGSQACMGIASGDFNRDGTLDLHITNFRNESANLFMQSRSGFFSDEVLKYGLAELSFDVLGFGTQAADFDNDGWLDMAVLNGHVFDARPEGVPFRMPGQLLRGSKQGFTLQQASAGPYWQKNRLGRTMAMMDWNRDGRIDLIANHLDDPIVLLQNDSPSQNWLQIELVGVNSERDAVGAEVYVRCGDETLTGWQIGGDGFMCSNEPIIHFGLGANESIDSVEVHWPSGQSQTFKKVPANVRYLIVEGESEPFRR